MQSQYNEAISCVLIGLIFRKKVNRFSINRIIATGGAGFIGSVVARHVINDTPDAVCVVDKLTYAGNLENLAPVAKSDRFKFEKVNICDKDELDLRVQ